MRKIYYIISLIVLLLLVIFAGSMNTQRINWARIPYSGFKIPYGTYAMKEMLPDLFDSVRNSRYTVREILENHEDPVNVFSVSNTFGLNQTTDQEVEMILSRMEEGSNFLLASGQFYNELLDTLGLSTSYIFNGEGSGENRDYSLGDFFTNDTTLLNLHLIGDEKVINRDDILVYFNQIDSARTEVLATAGGQAVAVRIVSGTGSIILVSSPFLFSNIYLVQGGSHRILEYFSSFLPSEDLYWTEYYQMGTGLAQTPLRYILGEEALRWAFYLLLGGLVVFVLVEVKRKQRAIPVVLPPSNDSLQFVGTVSNLYLERRDNRSIALKRINFFLDKVRAVMLISTAELDEHFIERLARKSGMGEKKIKALVVRIQFVYNNQNISDELLVALSRDLDEFYSKNLIHEYGK